MCGNTLGVVFPAHRRSTAPIKKAKNKPRSKQPKKVKFISKYSAIFEWDSNPGREGLNESEWTVTS